MRSNQVFNTTARRRLFWVVSNPLGLIVLSQFGFNYHYLHHLYPSIPVFNLPEVHDYLMEGFVDYESYFVLRESYIKTLFGDLANHLRGKE